MSSYGKDSSSSGNTASHNGSGRGRRKENGNEMSVEEEEEEAEEEESYEETCSSENCSSDSSHMSSVSKTLYLTLHRDEDDKVEKKDVESAGREEIDEEEEEQEPKLRYERLSSDLRTILADDSASCIALHAKMMVLGTHWGRTHMLDAMGNAIPEVGPPDAKGAHSVTVSQISIDHAGEFVASCSLDGRVMIRGLLSRETDFTCSLDATVRAISIDPIYARAGSGKRFMTGDDKVILHEKGMFNRYKQQIICEKSGPISQIKWRGRFAAWSTRAGVNVFDVIEERTISLVKCDGPDHSDDVPTRIAWSDQFHLFVSMGNAVKTCVVKKREGRLRDTLPEYFVEISSSFSLEDSWVCGIAPLEKLLVLLTVPKGKTKSGDYHKPQLQVVDPLPDDYNEVSTDLLSIRGHEKYRPKDYHLEHLLEDKHFFVVSPKDIVLGRPRDTDDHIDWLITHEHFSEALDAAEQHRKLLKRHNVIDVGKKYLKFLIDDVQFKSAGELCQRIFGRNKQLWEEEVYRFVRLNQLRSIAPYLPREELQLDQTIYELTLLEFLRADKPGFLRIVREWSPALYSVKGIVKPLIEQLLLNPNDEDLQRSLATLFSYQGKYDKALAILLKLGHEDVFNLIREHNLFKACEDKILDLMELDETEAVKLFIENADKLPSKLIVDRLCESRRHLFLYLDTLVAKNYEESKKYHGKVVSLYADFAKNKLLPFLKSSDHYPIQEALETCQKSLYIEEQIFILARMGNTKEALNLITENLLDIHKAVDFCKEQDDPELWKDLIDRSIDKPYFINVLLHNIGTHVDPRILIKKIESGQEIPGLRDSLVQIIHDYRLQVSLQEGCRRILVSDCFSLMQRQVKTLTKGLAVYGDSSCHVCNRLLVNEARNSSDSVVFRCRHAFHIDCLGDLNMCTLCNKNSSRT